MFLKVDGATYVVYINAANPFAISHGKIVGIYPPVDESELPKFKAAWDKIYNEESEEKEWTVESTNGRQHQVLRIGEKFLCDCWPYRKAGTCKHIEAVMEECLF